ncbi:MAG: right-handed parallel beta-helix repeat-containing protein [Alphaproteobacteria bacterium]
MGYMTCRASIVTALGAFFALALLPSPVDAQSQPWAKVPVIPVGPEDAIETLVREAPEDATFVLAPGVYRQVSVVPKDGQRFIGLTRDGARAILNGAVVLDAWIADGTHWRAAAERRRYSMPGTCEPDFPLCLEREDLFLDGTMLRRVGSLDAVGPGTWAFIGRQVVIGEDPGERLVELSVTETAVRPTGHAVTLENLVVEKYIPGAQAGAISGVGTKDWRVFDVTARWNHGAGLDMGDRMLARGGAYNHNGQMGLRAEFGQAHVESVEIAHNNTAGYNWGWEAGGTKFLEMTRLTVRGTCVHDNYGPGLWTDANNVNVLYEDNLVFRNAGDGIKHEISYNAVIRNNVSAYNGFGMHRWLWGAQILVQNSSRTVVTGNTVDTLTEGGNGISIIYQNREADGGRWVATENRITDNRMILRGRARAGMGADFDRVWFFRDADNVFDRNAYRVAEGRSRFWSHRGDFRSLDYVKRHGLEGESTVSAGDLPPEQAMTCPDDL